MAGLYHRYNENELGQTLGDGEGQGSLECCSPWDSPVKNTGVGCLSSPPVDLSDPGIEPASPAVPALQADSLSLGHQGSP